MATASEALYLVQLALHADRVFSLARDRRLPLREVDTGYVVHALLRGLFGDRAPQPFVLLPPKGRSLPVLGYSAEDAEALRRHAEEFAGPELHAAVDWSRFAAKAMPTAWSSGRRLGFELHACPTVRMSKAGPHNAAGAEVDVFLARCWRAASAETPIDREAVYREWLAQQLDRRGGVRLVGASVAGFQVERVLRRTQAVEGQRKSRLPRKPEVTFEGELEVTDGGAFVALLRRGIGRHRAFGFGMLLVRPPRSC
jgi:CRISPR system Cascade subunit CasE